jgi:hypothetical protein
MNFLNLQTLAGLSPADEDAATSSRADVRAVSFDFWKRRDLGCR